MDIKERNDFLWNPKLENEQSEFGMIEKEN